MAAKKKNQKKSKKSKRTKKSAGRKSTPAKKLVRKRTTSKKSAKRTANPDKAKPKKQSLKQTTAGKTATVGKSRTPNKSQTRGPSAFLPETTGSQSGEQSGDLQGLSDVESADSESVDELMEEGNAFEAGVISGVERAGEREGREVRTREVPEDDVPGEYLDED
jgi:hypothetical protein